MYAVPVAEVVATRASTRLNVLMNKSDTE